MSNNRLLQVLSHRPFFFLFLGEIFTQIAINIMNFVLIIVVYELTNSNTAVSGIVLTITIPSIFFGILAGVYVDRWNKKTVLILTNFIRAALLCVLLAFHTNVWVIFLISFVVSIVTQFFIPAETPMIPLTVSKKLLFSANALFGMGIYGSILLAYALSSPFLFFFGHQYVYLALAALFLLGGVCVFLVKQKKEGEEETVSPDFISELKQIMVLISKTKKIFHAMLLITLSQVLVLIVGVIGPGYAKEILSVPVNQFPLLFVTPGALGMLLGVLVLDHLFYDASRQKIATIGVLLSGFCFVLLSSVQMKLMQDMLNFINGLSGSLFEMNSLSVMMVLSFVLGIANAFVFVPSNTLMQELTSDNVRGKLYGGLSSMVGVFSLVPVLVVGPFADIYGVAQVILWVGLAVIGIGIWRMIQQK